MSALEKAGTSRSALFLDTPVISTERLILRPPHEHDAEEMAELANNIAIARMLGTMPHPYSQADAEEFISSALENGGRAAIYAITESLTGNFLGVGSLNEDPARYDEPFLGYWIGEPYWRKGFATEAARALVDLFFKATNRPVLLISARADNEPSKRIIRKCGGRLTHTSRAFNKVLGEWHELEHYRVTRENWMGEIAA